MALPELLSVPVPSEALLVAQLDEVAAAVEGHRAARRARRGRDRVGRR